LLPLPYTEESLEKLCDNINKVQDYFSRKILIENPSTYLEFKSTMKEYEYINKAIEKTGCGILLDLNNIFVNFKNHGHCPYEYVDNIEASNIGEVHLAGHSICKVENHEIRIDTHSKPVCDEVWELYKHLIKTKGCFPTLIEWDLEIPKLNTLLSEVKKANLILNSLKNNEAA
jgi:hypothetical protein